MDSVVIVGPGRVGLSLGYALAHLDGEIDVVYMGRRPEPPAHPVFFEGLAEYRHGLHRPTPGTRAVFLTVPDRAIAEVAVSLAERGDAPPGCAAFHCSGVLAADPLAPLHERGYAVGTMHPLQSVAQSGRIADTYGGVFFALSGEPEALATARRLVSILGGQAVSISASRRPLYHAGAVVASNYLVLLLREAVELLVRAGVREEEAEAAITVLARSTLDNVAELGLENALTGPLMRGDAETIALHLRTLDPEEASLYARLGRRGLRWLEGRLPDQTVAEIDTLFDRYS